MFLDDLDPPKKTEKTYKKLDTLSVDGLQNYIKELESEIMRTKEEINRRGSARNKAEAVFGKKE